MNFLWENRLHAGQVLAIFLKTEFARRVFSEHHGLIGMRFPHNGELAGAEEGDGGGEHQGGWLYQGI